jgi:carbon storage regulator CsrA
MLVLSRKSKESVVVGASGDSERMLKVTVLEINSRSVRLGFEANKDIPVHRWEVWEQIRANGRRGTNRSARPDDGLRSFADEVHDDGIWY